LDQQEERLEEKNDEEKQLAERLKVMRKARDDQADDLQNISVRTKSASANIKDGVSAKSVPELKNMVAEVASA
jgi:hypothetical protein